MATQTLKTLFYPGSPLGRPATNLNFLRLYQHNLCPFAARARYAFAAKEIPHQLVETCLSNTGDWHQSLNEGTVPVLETPNGTLISNSSILM